MVTLVLHYFYFSPFILIDLTSFTKEFIDLHWTCSYHRNLSSLISTSIEVTNALEYQYFLSCLFYQETDTQIGLIAMNGQKWSRSWSSLAKILVLLIEEASCYQIEQTIHGILPIENLSCTPEPLIKRLDLSSLPDSSIHPS